MSVRPASRPEWRYRRLKRVFDLTLAVIVLCVGAPLWGLIALCIKVSDGGPVLYGQRRVGFQGRRFTLWKFRSMVVGADERFGPLQARTHDPRVTRIGRVLRPTALDELPQLWNILKGEMSFVGPRPERPEFVERLREVEPLYDERHTLRPGITGWAQVCYPYTATEQDGLRKLEYDLFYLKNLSVWFDLAIVVQTVKTVLWGRGR
jgi:exopolysaccharide biosynthesis polyprenyl glycosylphosphotransferase